MERTCSVMLQRPLPATVGRQLCIVGEVTDAQRSAIICPVWHAWHESQDCLNRSVSQVMQPKVPAEPNTTMRYQLMLTSLVLAQSPD